MVRLLKHGRVPGKRLERLLRRLEGKKVSDLTPEDVEVLRKYNLLRSRRALTLDVEHEARIPKYVGTWVRHPGRYDIPGVDTPSSPTAEVISQRRKRRYGGGKRERSEEGGAVAVNLSESSFGDLLSGLTRNSLRGSMRVKGLKHVRFLAKLCSVFDPYSSLLMIKGGEARIIGLNVGKTMFSDVSVMSAEGKVWPLDITEVMIPSGKSLDLTVSPSKESGVALVRVNGVERKVSELSERDAKFLFDSVENLYSMLRGKRALSVEIYGKNVLRRLRSALRNSRLVIIGKDGIKVCMDNECRDKAIFRDDGINLRVNGNVKVKRFVYDPTLLLRVLPPSDDVMVRMNAFEVDGDVGPLQVTWDDGLIRGTFFLAPRIIDVNEELEEEVEQEINVGGDLASILLSMAEAVRSFGKRHGVNEVNIYITDNAVMMADQNNTAVLVVPMRTGVGEGKVIVIDKPSGLINAIKGSDYIVFKTMKGSDLLKVEGVGVGGSVEDYVGFISDLDDVRIPYSVKGVAEEIRAKGGDGVFNDVIRNAQLRGEVRKDGLRKLLRKKFNMLRIRERRGRWVAELVEETAMGEEKEVGELAELKGEGIEHGFSIGRRYASVKPWLSVLSKIGEGYLMPMWVNEGIAVMRNGDAVLAITQSYY